MKYRQLGNSGLLVSELTLGTMIFGEDSQRSTPPAEAENLIQRYLDAGGNHIDTADIYAAGRSEEIVGMAIKGKRHQVVLATKVNFPLCDRPNGLGLSRYHIMDAVNASLRRLQTDYIDLYVMHAWDPVTPIEESLRAFDDLVTAGKVRYVGFSNFKAWQVMKALAVSDARGWSRLIAGQYQYSLVKRDIEYEFIDLFQSEGVGLTVWGPLGGSFLTGKYQQDQRPQAPGQGRLAVATAEQEESWERRSTDQNWSIIDTVGDIASERRASHAQIALAWLRAQPAVSSVILGVRTMAQLEDNLGAADFDLTSDELERLDRVSALPEMYPYRFLESYARKMPD
jgi:aryl-alcohol dehydrogenase-like predicted oxidoreductase